MLCVMLHLSLVERMFLTTNIWFAGISQLYSGFCINRFIPYPLNPAVFPLLLQKLHRYWFVLVEDKHQVALVYFKNEDSYIARQRNEGFLRVDDSNAINVIGEYLGSKNAFAIITPRNTYTLVPESRSASVSCMNIICAFTM